MPRKKRDPSMTHRHRKEPKGTGCLGCGEPSRLLYCDACRVPAAQSAPAADIQPPGDRSAGRRERLEITLPWSILVSDNNRQGVLNGRLILTRQYRQAKKAQRDEARRQTPHPHPHMKGRVRLTAHVWFPDTEEHDAGNLRKATTDALEGVVYRRDSQIKDERWIDAGVDPDNPRAEIVVEACAVDTQTREAA